MCNDDGPSVLVPLPSYAGLARSLFQPREYISRRYHVEDAYSSVTFLLAKLRRNAKTRQTPEGKPRRMVVRRTFENIRNTRMFNVTVP